MQSPKRKRGTEKGNRSANYADDADWKNDTGRFICEIGEICGYIRVL